MRPQLKFYLILTAIILLVVSVILIKQSFELFNNNKEKTQIEMDVISKALIKYNKDLETTEIHLSRIIGSNPMRKGWKYDNWDTPYKLNKTDSIRFILASAGPDKEWNTEDDLLKSIHLKH